MAEDTSEKFGVKDDTSLSPDTVRTLQAIREYADEGLHSGDVPATLDELLADLRIWIENYDTFTPSETDELFEDTSECPEHGTQTVVRHDVTKGSDPYDIEILACGHGVICMGPGEPNTIVRSPR